MSYRRLLIYLMSYVLYMFVLTQPGWLQATWFKAPGGGLIDGELYCTHQNLQKSKNWVYYPQD